MENNLIVYPHQLFDLDVDKVRMIIGNTFEFTYDILETYLPELITEIKDKAGVKTISDTTLNQAIEAVENNMKLFNRSFDKRMSEHKWEYTKDRASKNYFKVLNDKGALVYVLSENYFKVLNGQDALPDVYKTPIEDEGKGRVICLPLYHALAEMSVAIFDYSLSKSGKLKRKLQKSNDLDRQKILNTRDVRALKYIFVNVLVEYGASTSRRQVIRNMETVFGTDVNKAIKSSINQPKYFR